MYIYLIGAEVKGKIKTLSALTRETPLKLAIFTYW